MSRQDLSAAARDELKVVAEALGQPGLAEADLRARMEELSDKGAHGELLESKLRIRREMRRGPMLMEYLYPVGLLVLSVLALATHALDHMAGWMVVYVLLLRNVIGLLQKLAGLAISVGRFHPPLVFYVDVYGGAPDPQSPFFRQSKMRSEELRDF